MTSLPAHLIKNSGVVSEVEKSKGIYVCHTWLIRRSKSLPATENPIKMYSWICSYPLWKENFFRRGFWWYPWPGQCLPGWSLFGRWPPLFCQRLMLSLPLPWQISLQIKHPLSQEGEKTSFQVILKILMGVKIAELNSHNCKLDFWGAVSWSVCRMRCASAKAPLCDQARRAWWVDR